MEGDTLQYALVVWEHYVIVIFEKLNEVRFYSSSWKVLQTEATDRKQTSLTFLIDAKLWDGHATISFQWRRNVLEACDEFLLFELPLHFMPQRWKRVKHSKVQLL